MGRLAMAAATATNVRSAMGPGSMRKNVGTVAGLDDVASKYHVGATRYVCLSKERTLTLLRFTCLSCGVSEPLAHIQLGRTKSGEQVARLCVQSHMLTLNVDRI